MQINLSAQQAQVLVNLIDVAVKAAGLQAAEAGSFFSRIIKEAADKEQAEQGEASQEAAVEAQAA